MLHHRAMWSVDYVNYILIRNTMLTIIPLEEWQKVEKEEDEHKAEELATQESRDRKRVHTPSFIWAWMWTFHHLQPQ
jgi:hypothetical protein